LILRWFWWRVNAICEIVATVTPFIVYGVIHFYFPDKEFNSPTHFFIIVPITTLAWVVTSFLTKPTKEERLLDFYKIVHPGGFGWKKIAAKLPDVKSDTGYFVLFIDWGLGIILVYMFLFGIGKNNSWCLFTRNNLHNYRTHSGIFYSETRGTSGMGRT